MQRPPVVFQLAGHPLRWQLIGELARSDRRVRELSGLLDQPQPLVSYHLRQLRAAHLVSTRRSSFDGRDSYYSLDLDRCAELLVSAGAAIHPALSLESSNPPAARRRSPPPRVLFLCTGNSSRSQMAEALLRERTGGAVAAFSGGSRPKPLHPNAIRAMSKRGIDISQQRSKHLGTFRRKHFDYVISLCDRVREVCPEFPGQPRTIHWSIPDPAAEPGSDRETYSAFERTATELELRLRYLLHQIQQEGARS
jgi:ArsR family transcriptional regulator, arsenate/arsenite/antimonite-responsive transcriptional repressor / arsenate reductase (thioredoxin)